MNKLRFLTLLAAALLAACTGPHPIPQPAWTLASPTLSAKGLEVVGMSYPSPDERSAREGAMRDALTVFLRYTGMEVSSYARMVTREMSSENEIGQVKMDNASETTIATRGFVREVNQQIWTFRKDAEGRYIGFVRMLVPRSEVFRVESEKEAQKEARLAPYRKALASFRSATQAHDLARAEHLIPSLVKLGKRIGPDDGVSPEGPDQLGQELGAGLTITPCSPLRFDLDQMKRAEVDICVAQNGSAVPNFPLSLQVPSGLEIPAVTGGSGQADFHLPSPVHPGNYPLVVRLQFKDLKDYTLTFNYRVTGRKEGLAKGEFHNYIEARAVGTVGKRLFKNRSQGEQLALLTARNLAYAQLLQEKDGLDITSNSSMSGAILEGDHTDVNFSGHLKATVGNESVGWDHGVPVAQVTLRMPLGN